MGESKSERTWTWMANLSDKYDISLDTVLSFYKSICLFDDTYGMTKRERLEEFFKLYFDEVRRDD